MKTVDGDFVITNNSNGHTSTLQNILANFGVEHKILVNISAYFEFHRSPSTVNK